MKLLAVIVGIIIFGAAAQAQTPDNRCLPAKDFYNPGTGPNCWYKSLFHPNCPDRSQSCTNIAADAQKQESQTPLQTTYPSEVAKQVLCDISHAVQTSGDADLKSAKIRIALTSSLVVKNNSSGSVSIGIPVFTGIKVAPSLSLADTRTTSTTGLTELRIDASKLPSDAQCPHYSTQDWVTGEIATNKLFDSVVTSELSVGSQFVVTNENGGGLSLNIFPVSLGPKFSAERDVIQQVCIVFDMSGQVADPKTQTATKCPSAPGGGSTKEASGDTSAGN